MRSCFPCIANATVPVSMIKRFFKLDGNEHILGTKLIKGIERDPDEDPEDDGDKDEVDTYNSKFKVFVLF